MNSRRLFNESNIGGLDYLRNLVHLPFYLQSAGLQKVRIAQQTAQMNRKIGAGWTEDDHIGIGGAAVLARSVRNDPSTTSREL